MAPKRKRVAVFILWAKDPWRIRAAYVANRTLSDEELALIRDWHDGNRLAYRPKSVHSPVRIGDVGQLLHITLPDDANEQPGPDATP